MNRPWIYLINTFLVTTEDSYRKMKQIGDFTYAAVSAAADAATNPDDKALFTSILTMLQPPVDEYDQTYVTWLSQQGMQKGKTRSLTDLLNDLRGTQVQEWDLAIQNVYRQNTPPYIALMPRHRTPFQQGTQQERISAVGALSLAIGKDPKLQSLKASVDEFYDELVTANNSQKGSKSTKSGSSAELEADRITLGITLYGVLGLLMNHYQSTPAAIAPFFLIELLRNKEQTEWEHELKPGETRLALTHTFEPGQRIVIADKANTGLQVALVASKTDPMPADAYTLKPGEQESLLPEQLGAAGNRFLLIRNLNDLAKGDYHIVLD